MNAQIIRLADGRMCKLCPDGAIIMWFAGNASLVVRPDNPAYPQQYETLGDWAGNSGA